MPHIHTAIEEDWDSTPPLSLNERKAYATVMSESRASQELFFEISRYKDPRTIEILRTRLGDRYVGGRIYLNSANTPEEDAISMAHEGTHLLFELNGRRMNEEPVRRREVNLQGFLVAKLTEEAEATANEFTTIWEVFQDPRGCSPEYDMFNVEKGADRLDYWREVHAAALEFCKEKYMQGAWLCSDSKLTHVEHYTNIFNEISNAQDYYDYWSLSRREVDQTVQIVTHEPRPEWAQAAALTHGQGGSHGNYGPAAPTPWDGYTRQKGMGR